MSDDANPFQRIDADQPIDDECESVKADSALYVAQVALGLAGRMISPSKVWFMKFWPDHFPVFNANVCISPPRKIWFGDLDLTEDEGKLAVLARALGTNVYALQESDGRFGGRDQRPLLERALMTVTPEGAVEHAAHIHRGADGRLRPAG